MHRERFPLGLQGKEAAHTCVSIYAIGASKRTRHIDELGCEQHWNAAALRHSGDEKAGEPEIVIPAPEHRMIAVKICRWVKFRNTYVI